MFGSCLYMTIAYLQMFGSCLYMIITYLQMFGSCLYMTITYLQMFGSCLYTVNCNSEITLPMMTQYMMGMVQSGCWALFDDTDRLTKGKKCTIKLCVS